MVRRIIKESSGVRLVIKPKDRGTLQLEDLVSDARPTVEVPVVYSQTKPLNPGLTTNQEHEHGPLSDAPLRRADARCALLR